MKRCSVSCRLNNVIKPKRITATITRIGVIIFRPRLMTIGLIDKLAPVLSHR